MKRFILYFFCGLIAFSATCGMFMLKYHVLAKQTELAQLHRKIMQNNRSIHILKAEWTNLSKPERLKMLADKNTKLQPVKASQIIRFSQIADIQKEP